jgi:hypothetical protein
VNGIWREDERNEGTEVMVAGKARNRVGTPDPLGDQGGEMRDQANKRAMCASHVLRGTSTGELTSISQGQTPIGGPRTQPGRCRAFLWIPFILERTAPTGDSIVPRTGRMLYDDM